MEEAVTGGAIGCMLGVKQGAAMSDMTQSDDRPTMDAAEALLRLEVYVDLLRNPEEGEEPLPVKYALEAMMFGLIGLLREVRDLRADIQLLKDANAQGT